MKQSDLTRLDQLRASRGDLAVIDYLTQIISGNKNDSFAMVLLGEEEIRRGNYDTAHKHYGNAMAVLAAARDTESNPDYVANILFAGLGQIDAHYGRYEGACDALERCLPSELEGGVAVISEKYIFNYLDWGFKARGFNYAESIGKRLMEILKVDNIRPFDVREELAAIIYILLAWHCLSRTTDNNGLHFLIDESPDGIAKCKKYCSIVFSYTILRYGNNRSNIPARFDNLVNYAYKPWRVANGLRDDTTLGSQIAARHDFMIEPIQANGMFDFIP